MTLAAAGPLLDEPMPVLAVLLAILAVLFGLQRHPWTRRLFQYVPLLVFCYFVPTAFSNTGVIPGEGFVLYGFIQEWLLPASLVLLILAIDVPAILRLGRPALVLFLTATVSIVLGGPLAYLILGSLGAVPESLGEDGWKGLAALSGSWIGGGANFVAVGAAFEAPGSIMAVMPVIDVAVANVWMAVLLFFAGRERAMDEGLGADRRALDEVRERVEAYQAEHRRYADLPDFLLMLALAFGTTALARAAGGHLAGLWTVDGGGGPKPVISTFTWTVILCSTVSLGLSFTRARRLEGAGASAVGSVFLYLLVAVIGARAEFHRILDPGNLGLLAVGALWMAFHAAAILLVRRWMRAPIFFAAVGSQANVGGAASAPIVASAFHRSLAPVGVLLAVAGYLVGIYGGILCGVLLRAAASVVHGAPGS